MHSEKTNSDTMIYTPRMIDAVHFAAEVHQLGTKPQYRKEKDVPYITHPLTVGLILSQARASEEVVIAGILHDVIEDCEPYGSVTKEQLVERFGPVVASLVDDVTEKNKTLGWHERKEAALEEIRQFSSDALLVKSADVISNNTELIRDYEAEGMTTFDRFNAKQADIVSHILLVISCIRDAWGDNPLDTDLQAVEVGLKQLSEVNE